MIRGGSERRDGSERNVIRWLEGRGRGEGDGRLERWRSLVSGHDSDRDLAVGKGAKDGGV